MSIGIIAKNASSPASSYQTKIPTNAGLNTSVRKLSTGSRINQPSDDSAGLAVAERLKKRLEQQKGRDVALSLNPAASVPYDIQIGPGSASGAQNTNVARLSSGSRINSSGEDSEGLRIQPPLPSGGTDQDVVSRQSASAGSTPSPTGGVSNLAGAPGGLNREQAIQRYRDNSSSDTSNPSDSILQRVRG